MPDNNSKSTNKIDNATFAISEYTALRSEILKRIEIQHQLITLTLVVAGTFLSLGSQTNADPVVLLVYPIIAMFLAIGWEQNMLHIRQLGIYIRDRIESRISGGGWENHRTEFSTQYKSYTTLFTRGTFVGTQLIAVGLALSKSTYTSLQIGLLLIDAIAIIVTLLIIKRLPFTRRQNKRKGAG